MIIVWFFCWFDQQCCWIPKAKSESAGNMPGKNSNTAGLAERYSGRAGSASGITSCCWFLSARQMFPSGVSGNPSNAARFLKSNPHLLEIRQYKPAAAGSFTPNVLEDHLE